MSRHEKRYRSEEMSPVSKWDPLELVIVHALLVRWVRRVIDMAPRLRTSNAIGNLSSDTDYLPAQPILF